MVPATSPQEKKELLAKATLAVTENSAALRDTTADAEKAKAELRLARQGTARLHNEVKEVGPTRNKPLKDECIAAVKR